MSLVHGRSASGDRRRSVEIPRGREAGLDHSRPTSLAARFGTFPSSKAEVGNRGVDVLHGTGADDRVALASPRRLDGIPTSRYCSRMIEQARHEFEDQQLLTAAMNVIRAKGYAAATVDDICRSGRRHQGRLFPSLQQQGRSGPVRRGLIGMGQRRRSSPRRLSSVESTPWSGCSGYVDFRAEILRGRLAGLHLPSRHAGSGNLRHASEIRAACEKGLSSRTSPF